MSVLSSRLTSHPKFFFLKLAIFIVKFSIIKGFFFFLILLFFMQDYCVPVISDCFYVEEEKK